jgi:hypothetical protein
MKTTTTTMSAMSVMSMMFDDAFDSLIWQQLPLKEERPTKTPPDNVLTCINCYYYYNTDFYCCYYYYSSDAASIHSINWIINYLIYLYGCKRLPIALCLDFCCVSNVGDYNNNNNKLKYIFFIFCKDI